MWREVKHDESDILRIASRFEREFPTFYRNASSTWTVDEQAILEFYQSCCYLYGIWDREELVGLLYFQPVTGTHHAVHLDAKRGADKAVLLEAFCGVRDHRFENETLSTETWVLRQNRPLQRMLRKARFTDTGLEMRAGKSHGKSLRWIQLVVRRSNGETDTGN